jgi:hypothetical protein
VAIWGCLECPNAVFTDRHLPTLIDFAAFLDSQRESMTAPEWDARYGLARERLAGSILPAFPDTALTTACAPGGAAAPALPAQLLEQLT